MAWSRATRAGRSVARAARRRSVVAVIAGVLTVALTYASLAAAPDPSSFALLAAALATAALAVHSARRAGDFRRGAEAERQVAGLLDGLAGRDGIRVEHDVRKHGGGNIDHVVHADGLVVAIETKRSRLRPSDVAQAQRHALWAERHYRRRAIPVICIARSGQRPRSISGVWVIGASRLPDWLAPRRAPARRLQR
jgi:hypothetical protein